MPGENQATSLNFSRTTIKNNDYSFQFGGLNPLLLGLNWLPHLSKNIPCQFPNFGSHFVNFKNFIQYQAHLEFFNLLIAFNICKTKLKGAQSS